MGMIKNSQLIIAGERSPNNDLGLNSTLNGSDCPDVSPLYTCLFLNDQQSCIDYKNVKSFQQKQLKAELKQQDPKNKTYTKKLLSPISFQNKINIKKDQGTEVQYT